MTLDGNKHDLYRMDFFIYFRKYWKGLFEKYEM